MTGAINGPRFAWRRRSSASRKCPPRRRGWAIAAVLPRALRLSGVSLRVLSWLRVLRLPRLRLRMLRPLALLLALRLP
ncbi:hypothetical protein [Salinisphaera sp.]|uniref:hypothetical protein n=1 Tax=Salinisphaera sp. TaxID=1914330 RepID=UPI003C7A4B6B